ncbi:MAG: acetate--CoA ligase family protein [Candidatus Micrarchaeia archaeon]
MVSKQLDYMSAKSLLESYNIASVRSAYVNSPDEAEKFGQGKPIVLKAIPEQPVHKAKSNLIMLNLKTPESIRKAYIALEKNAQNYKPYKILAQEMIKGTEIIVGGRKDSQFGKLILVGLGGIYVEVFKDFAVRICPITSKDADSMINQLKSKSIICQDAAQAKMLRELLLKVSKMLMENNISELDLNPVIISGRSYHAVDLRIIVDE